MLNTSEQMTRLYSSAWPMLIVVASGVVVGIAVNIHWTKFRNRDHALEGASAVQNDHAFVLPCLLSLIEALQQYLERLQLEVSAEDWNAFVSALCRALDAVKKELERIRDASELDTSLDRVVRAIDNELVGQLRKEQGVLSILDSYLPRRGQKWNDLLDIRNEDEKRFYRNLLQAKESGLELQAKESGLELQAKESGLELQARKRVELVGILLNFMDELKSDLQQSKSIEVSRTGDFQPVETTRYSLVKVFFATDRELTADAEYLGKMSRMIVQKEVPLQYGWVEVGIPADHSPGTLEAPRKGLSEEADPSKHIVIFSVDTELRGNLQGFLEVVNKDLSSGDLLVYIHGYKTSHLKAVKQAAQLKYDLKFEGTIILYSWSSAGTVSGYYTDEKNIEKAAVSLHKLLKSIMNEVKAPRAHIIAHSMGNRALVGALRRLYAEVNQSPPVCPLSQIILVAADEERSLFEQLVEKANESYPSNTDGSSSSHKSETDLTGTSSGIVNSRPHFSVYCSSEDRALGLSAMIHLKYRLGDTRSLPISTAAGLQGHDVIDTTGVEQGTSKYNHSYHLQSSKVIEDIQVLLKHRKPACSRPNLFVKDGSRPYYAFESPRSNTRLCL